MFAGKLSFSVTRLADISKFLATNFLTKVAQILDELLGNFENVLLSKKLLWLLFAFSDS